MVKKYCQFLITISVAVAVSGLVVGCAPKTVKPVGQAEKVKTVAVESVTEMPAESVDRQPAQPIGTEESIYSEPVTDMAALNILEGRTTGPMLPIYFDFDQSSIRSDQNERMAGNATHLKTNLKAMVVIEGNCDERGTNEYNMALGERRAIGAKKYLVNLGVAAGKINTISYGEEMPLNHGHDELSWSQNRRADFIETK